MDWQNIIVYTVLAVCVLLTAFKLRKAFSKKQDKDNKCANCNCGCNTKSGKSEGK